MSLEAVAAAVLLEGWLGIDAARFLKNKKREYNTSSNRNRT
jgi:hypothetical protein